MAADKPVIDTRALSLDVAATNFCDVICEIEVGTVVVENAPQYTVPSLDRMAVTTAVVFLASTDRVLADNRRYEGRVQLKGTRQNAEYVDIRLCL